MTEDGRTRLASAVRDRRAALGLSVRAAAKLAHIDRDTWGDMEAGSRTLRDYNYASVERALGWAAGSVDAIMVGRDPQVRRERPDVDAAPDREIDLVRTDPRLSDEMKVRIIGLIFERRARERDAGIEETKRIIEVMRDQAAS